MRQIFGVLSIVLGVGIVAPSRGCGAGIDRANQRPRDGHLRSGASGRFRDGDAHRNADRPHDRHQRGRSVHAAEPPGRSVSPGSLPPGFQTFVQSGITIQVNANLVVDPSLRLGDVTETITVQARASDIEVETRRMGVGTVVEQERILELPLNARQVTDLITLSGAAVQVPNSVIGNMVTGVNISVAGGGRWGVQYLLDGAINNNRCDATNMPLPFPDALQEFRISTSAQEASVGRASGASVNAVTKAGTNQFHGNAFWFVRDTRFNARAAHAATKDKLQRNQPGGSIGGPIVQNKLFFFAGYQSTVLDQTLSDTLSIVPTAAMLARRLARVQRSATTRRGRDRRLRRRRRRSVALQPGRGPPRGAPAAAGGSASAVRRAALGQPHRSPRQAER